MNPCEECPLEDKVYECCGRFPDTGDSAYLEIDAARGVYACPFLDAEGLCTIYEQRPLKCRSHSCPEFNPYQKIGRLCETFGSPWKPSDF
jgi:Fe-S-cluster containining protein